VFSAGENPFGSESIVKEASVLYDLSGRISVATASQRVVSFVVERDVEDWAEVEVESEDAQKFAGDCAVTPNEFGIVSVSKLVCVGRFITNEFEP
jgi:hypothetical protein